MQDIEDMLSEAREHEDILYIRNVKKKASQKNWDVFIYLFRTPLQTL